MCLGLDFLAEYAWEIEQAREYADSIWWEAQDGIWTTKDGRRIPVRDMTTSHILNTIAYIKRNWDTDIYQPWIDVFEEELERRNHERK